jgi:hypothetical protein
VKKGTGSEANFRLIGENASREVPVSLFQPQLEVYQ